MIRILFLLTSPVRGGVEEVVLSILQRIDRQVFAPGLLAPAPLLEEMAADLSPLELPTFAANGDRLTRPAEIARVAGALRSFRPDLVNTHLFRSSLVGAPIAKLFGARVVETYHGRELWRLGGWSGNFAVDRLVTRGVDRLIAVSEAAKRFLVETKGLPAAKIKVVPNGRDLSVYSPGAARDEVRAELGLDPEDLALGFVGRLEEQKGHRFAIAAMPAILAAHPRARLLLAGDGSLRADLEAQAQAVGVAEAVRFLGFRSDAPRILDATDLALLPSLHEGMPLTAIEAAAMARPIVATAVDGTPEVVVEGETGWLVPPSDAGALAQAVVGALADRPRLQAMGERARARALECFDVAKSVELTCEIYRDVLR